MVSLFLGRDVSCSSLLPGMLKKESLSEYAQLLSIAIKLYFHYALDD
jgi:hypothetical protein